MVAEATTGAPRLRLFWDNEEIKNAYSVKIAIWNAGREYLDKDSISATDPIRVIIPPDVQILYASFTRTSRDNLSLTATDLSDTGTNAIQIQIVGDEALEQKDGGILKILYTGQSSDEFAVTGRIKGCKQGFDRTSWLDPTGREEFLQPMAMFSTAIVLPGIGILWGSIRLVRDSRKYLIFIGVVGVLLGIAWVAIGMILVYSFVSLWLSYPQWIT